MSTKNTGLIYVFTGDGKGKTSAGLGVAVRALAHGWSVDWIALYKEASWQISEFSLPDMFLPEHRERFRMHILGKGFYLPETAQKIQKGSTPLKVASVGSAKIIDDDEPEQHRASALSAIQKAHEILSSDTPPEVLVLDEICNALSDELVLWSELEELINTRGTTNLILTGRNAPSELIEVADLVSNIVKEKTSV